MEKIIIEVTLLRLRARLDMAGNHLQHTELINECRMLRAEIEALKKRLAEIN